MVVAHAHVIETSDEDAFDVLSQFVGGLEGAPPGFAEECEQLHAAEQYEELLDKFVSALDVVLSSNSSDTDLECCLNMTCHLVPRIALPEAAAAAAQRLAAALAASTASRPDKRLQALVTLYNASYDSASKAVVLMEALGYAQRAGLSDIMLPVIRAHADQWAGDLSLDAAAERLLYTTCAGTLAGCSRKPRTAAREAYRLLTKCLTTYEDASPSELPGAIPAAAAVVSEFIRSPDMFQFDLYSNPAVQQLGGSQEHSDLHRLLTIFLLGTVHEFQIFAATPEGAAALAAAGIAEEAALAKMRLLAFMGLAHGGTEITFAQIQAALVLGPEEVEAAVVQAIGKKIAEARIDQLRRVVAVSKCAPRAFGPQHWLELQQVLTGWKEAAIMAQQALAEAGGGAGAASGRGGSIPNQPSAAPVRA